MAPNAFQDRSAEAFGSAARHEDDPARGRRDLLSGGPRSPCWRAAWFEARRELGECLSQSSPIYRQRLPTGVLNSGGWANPTTPLSFID
jgi:hypothetical protein